MTIEVNKEKYELLLVKASVYDAILEKVEAIYQGEEDEDDFEADLGTIGEICAHHLGFL